ncbi:hypothetical protein AAC387_Pa03g3288 [Persea americana]
MIELSIIYAHSHGVILLLHRASQGDTLGLINPLSNKSCNWVFNSLSSAGAILDGALEITTVPSTNSIEKSISLTGGKSGISSGKTSGNSQTTGISSIPLDCLSAMINAKYPSHPDFNNLSASNAEIWHVRIYLLRPTNSIVSERNDNLMVLLVDPLAAAASIAGIASANLRLISATVALHRYIAGNEELVIDTGAVVLKESADLSAVVPAEVLSSKYAAYAHETLLPEMLATDYRRWDNHEPDVQTVHNENMPQSPCSTAQ